MNLSELLKFIKFFFGSDKDLAITDNEGIISFAGKNLCRFLDIPIEKVVGEKVELILEEISPDLKNAWLELARQLESGKGLAFIPVEFIHGQNKITVNISAIKVEDDMISSSRGGTTILSMWQASIPEEENGGDVLRTLTLRRAERYRKLFEHAPVGIFRSTPDGRILEANATIASLLKYPSPMSLIDSSLIDFYADPKEVAVWLNLVMQSDEPVATPMRLKCYDDSEIEVNVYVRAVRNESGEVRYFDGIFDDISEKMDSKDVFDRYTFELAAVHKLANKVNQVLTTNEVVDAAMEEISLSVNPDICMIFIRNENALELVNYSSRAELDIDGQQHTVGNCLCGLAAESDISIISTDIMDDFRCTMNECKQAGVQSFIAIPLRGPGRNLGVLGLASKNKRHFEDEKIFLEAMAAQTSVALNNAITYETMEREVVERRRIEKELQEHRRQLVNEVEQRTQEINLQNINLQNQVSDRNRAQEAEKEQRALAQALENTAAVLNQTQDLDEVLDRILLNLEAVVPHDSANIMLLDDAGHATVVRYKGNPEYPQKTERLFSNFSVGDTPTLDRMKKSLKPMFLSNVEYESDWIPQLGSEWIKSFVAAPIHYGENLLGFLNLVSSVGDFYSAEHAERLLAFANHASIAIRNVHLFKQAREIATLEERQRLAREMHDGVSQTLFTASVIADTLQQQWERSPEKGEEGLEKIKRLTRGALAEMRSILIELRPGALLEADLGDLLQQLGEGAMSYLEITIGTKISGRHKLPDRVQLSLYRMAQEIFNNIVKHARATHVSIEFENTGKYVYLSISDNGKGFNTGELRDDSFGLQIMQERADQIGATLSVVSEPQRGTNVTILWQHNREVE